VGELCDDVGRDHFEVAVTVLGSLEDSSPFGG
jgi:hypothetical protein